MPAPTLQLKPATSSDFNGDRKKGRALLNSCELSYALCPLDFVNDQARVLWTLLFMKAGHVNSFAEQMLRWEAKRGPWYMYASYTLF